MHATAATLEAMPAAMLKRWAQDGQAGTNAKARLIDHQTSWLVAHDTAQAACITRIIRTPHTHALAVKFQAVPSKQQVGHPL